MIAINKHLGFSKYSGKYPEFGDYDFYHRPCYKREQKGYIVAVRWLKNSLEGMKLTCKSCKYAPTKDEIDKAKFIAESL